MKLFADPACWKFRSEHPEEWESFACGPGDYGDYLVPDKILFLSVNEACRIHDWYYRFWPENTEDARSMADRILLNNMLRIIYNQTSGKWLKRARSRVALIYFRAVRSYGATAFFEDRNLEVEYKEV